MKIPSFLDGGSSGGGVGELGELGGLGDWTCAGGGSV